ncbi:MAG: lipid II:glycine glycyltransferase FemX [Bacteroidota bacterium]
MNIEIRQKNPQEIKNSTFIQQTPLWALAKKQQGCHLQGFTLKMADDEAHFRQEADMLIIYHHPAPDFAMAYIPYFPVDLPASIDEGIFLEECAEVLREQLDKHCGMIRFDLPWSTPWAYDDNRYDEMGTWMGNPDPYIQEMRMNFSNVYGNLRKAPTDALPSNTLIVPLDEPNENLLSGMKSKTRYNIRLSQRKGVEIRNATRNDLQIWMKLYKDTARRNGIHLQGLDVFPAVLNASEKVRGSHVELLLAEHDGEPLAGMFLAYSQNRVTYLFGASSTNKRNLMATYALQWEAMQRGKQAGCTYYDMFGVAPAPEPAHPMYGLYRFKTGFGGHLFHRYGCWDYPLNEAAYEVYRAVELQETGYHVN